MFHIKLESADNGVIKTVNDENSNGAGGKYESIKIYPVNDEKFDNDFRVTKLFLSDLLSDLGIYTGNKHHKKNLSIDIRWGPNYVPSKPEIKEKIELLEESLTELRKKL